MNYIKRDLESKILSLTEEYACILLTGARQVGKTTLFKKITKTTREYVSLDDLEERRLAQTDPALFFQLHKTPVLIDEVQYAPELFSYIKIQIDNGAKAGDFWLTGSQAFKLMSLASESLAGRVALIHMPAISQHELYSTAELQTFELTIEDLKQRKQSYKKADTLEIYQRIWQGSMPALVSGKYSDRDVFYSSYLQTYIDRDIAELIKISDKYKFQDFIRAAACRIGQLLNVHDIASDVGVSDDTAKRWLGVLEKSGIIFYLRPYSNNLLKRTIKMPKLYFFDTGLVAYLTKYSNAEILANGALNGQILENYVVLEIVKSFLNQGKDPLLWYYRDKASNEIDIVIEADGMLYPLEIKKTANPKAQLVKSFKVLDKASLKRGAGAVLCMREDFSLIDENNYIIPIWML